MSVMSRYYITNFGKAGIPHPSTSFGIARKALSPVQFQKRIDIMPRKRPHSSKIKALPSLPEHYEIEAVTLELRALRAMHDAMMQQLAHHECEKAVQTANVLLDRLNTSSLTSLMYSAAECLDEMKERPDLTLPDLLRELSDPVFGDGIL